MNDMTSLDISRLVLEKHFSQVPMTESHYPEVLSLHVWAKLAVDFGDEQEIVKVKAVLQDFVQGKHQHRLGAFRLYNIAGSATAYLLEKGLFDEAADTVKLEAEHLIKNVARGPKGFFAAELLDFPVDMVWIDKAFATTPFLTYSGLYFNDRNFLEEACRQLEAMETLFLDRKTGLYHQSYGIAGVKREPGCKGNCKLSEDHWGRGNGWGLFALSETALACPEELNRKYGINDTLLARLQACLDYQDEDGMWHQEITDHESYVETSGTGLILSALGVAVELGIADEAMSAALKKGLTALKAYIGLDGSVHNCCIGCMCPGQGTIEDYKKNPWKLNDPHAFGPVAFAYYQAAKVGL